MIRSVAPSDISQILQIYQHYILNSHVTFEEDDVYNQIDAEGFIKLSALRLRLAKKD